jgi:hypothetical protein
MQAHPDNKDTGRYIGELTVTCPPGVGKTEYGIESQQFDKRGMQVFKPYTAWKRKSCDHSFLVRHDVLFFLLAAVLSFCCHKQTPSVVSLATQYEHNETITDDAKRTRLHSVRGQISCRVGAPEGIETHQRSVRKRRI